MDTSNLFAKINLFVFSAVIVAIGVPVYLFLQMGSQQEQSLAVQALTLEADASLNYARQFQVLATQYAGKSGESRTRDQEQIRALFAQWRKSARNESGLDKLFMEMGLNLNRFLQNPPGSDALSEDLEKLQNGVLAAHQIHMERIQVTLREMSERQKNNRRIMLVSMLFMVCWFWVGRRYLFKNILYPLGQWYQYLRSPSKPDQGPLPNNGEDLRQLNEHLIKMFANWPQASEALGIVRSMTEGLLVISPNGVIQRANRSMEQMLGYEHDELLGRPFNDIYVKLKSVHVQGFFKRKTTYREEELFKTKEGNIIPVRFSSSFLFDTSMDVTGFICIAKDITKEKHVEEELLKQSEWFKVTLASIGDAVITTNVEGVVSFMNDIAESLTGWTTDEARDKHINEVFQIIYRIDREPLPMPAGKDLDEQTGSFRVHDLVLIHRSGREIPVDKSTAPIRSADGQLHGAVVVFRDVTELRRVAEELHNAKEKAEAAALAKDRFLANLSHEIRTPMNGVIGMTDLLLDSQLTTEQRDSAELVRGSAESLLALINDILDFSKIEAGKLELEHIPFQLRTCIEEVGDLLAQKAHEKGLEMPVLVGHDVPLTLVGDPGRLRQILLNLINNAVKFTEAGEIYIEVRLKEETESNYVIHVDIVDTGIGIPPEKLDRLFKPFSQVDATMSRKYGGTGLGLAICKELTEAMGGKITIQSKVGEGAAFGFNLVLGRPDTPDANRILIPAKIYGMRVLVADPHPTNRRVLRYYLEEAGCQVEEASFALEVMDSLNRATDEEKPYDLILLDFFLAEMDQFLEKLQSAHRPEIILTSSMQRRKAAAEATPRLARQYLTRPVKVNRLYKALLTVKEPEKSQEIRPEQPKDDGLRRLKQKFGAPRILVVDDNAVNQKVAVRLLEKQGYRCDVAFNGLQALEALGRIAYDLILMDCQMPEMDGFEATERIRSRTDEKKNTPIVAMTANALKGDRERCLDKGMDDYLSKPVNKKDLYAMLNRWLAEKNKSQPPVSGS